MPKPEHGAGDDLRIKLRYEKRSELILGVKCRLTTAPGCILNPNPTANSAGIVKRRILQ